MKSTSAAADPELPPVRVLIEAWIDKDDWLIMTSFNRSKYFAMNLSSEYAAALKKRSLVFTNKTLEAQQTDDTLSGLRAQIEDDIRSLTPYDLPNSQIGVSIFSVLDIIKQRIDSTEARKA